MKTQMVCASIETVEELYLSDDWRRIFQGCNNIRIPSSNPISLDQYVHDQPDSIWEMIERDGIVVHDKDSYLNELFSKPSSILKRPNDVYFVDCDTEKSLFHKLGMLINPQDTVSLKNKSAEPLMLQWKNNLEYEEEFSWDYFFNIDVINKIVPSNACIIVDRYLFSKFYEGLDNLLDILDNLLPFQLENEYHVLLIVDSEQTLKDGSFPSINKAVSKIQTVIDSLERTFPIVLEILFVKRKLDNNNKWTPSEKALVDFYNITHNRRIYTNYFVISAEHGLSAVKTSRNGIYVSAYKQAISFDSFYAGIQNPYQRITSLPKNDYDGFIRGLEKFIHSYFPQCQFFINGKLETINHMHNRLVD